MRPHRNVARWLAIALSVFMLSACSLAPTYNRPTIDVPATYKEAEGWKTAQPRDDIRRGNWWEIFGDPQLNALIERIDLSNQNILFAEAQYRQARSLVQQARASLFPSLTGSADITAWAQDREHHRCAAAGRLTPTVLQSMRRGKSICGAACGIP